MSRLIAHSHLFLPRDKYACLNTCFSVAGPGEIFAGRNPHRRHAGCAGQDPDVLVLADLPPPEEKQTEVPAAPAALRGRSK